MVLVNALVVCLAVVPLTPQGVRIVHVFLETAFAVREGIPIDEWRRLGAASGPGRPRPGRLGAAL